MSMSTGLTRAASIGLALIVTTGCGAASAQAPANQVGVPQQFTAPPQQYTPPPVQYVPPAVNQASPVISGGQPLDIAPRTTPGAGGATPGAFNPAQNPPENAIGSGGIIVTTTPGVDGYHVRRYLGVVRGVRVFQPTIGESFRASFKGIIGGNIGAYVDMCEKARQQAYDQLLERCAALGANAVLGFRYDSSAFSLNASEMGTEVICYGTAVYVEANR